MLPGQHGRGVAEQICALRSHAHARHPAVGVHEDVGKRPYLREITLRHAVIVVKDAFKGETVPLAKAAAETGSEDRRKRSPERAVVHDAVRHCLAGISPANVATLREEGPLL